ncbi:MAG: endonuclease [Gemmatimonadetes bacterium]|nr:endonuclease [Gemmatimonadota bacterium]
MSAAKKVIGKRAAGAAKPRERTRLPMQTRIIVLTEAGYRCAVPTCRGILMLDMHHMWEVSADGTDDPSNLIALCPTCHALYHRHVIRQESIYVYKAMLTAITRAFDHEAVDRLLFLENLSEDFLVVSGDGLLHFDRLIAGGLASATLKANNNWQLVTYAINISPKGRQLISAWRSGDRSQLLAAISAGAATSQTALASARRT